jgi:hypothetical protein
VLACDRLLVRAVERGAGLDREIVQIHAAFTPSKSSDVIAYIA